MDCGPGVTLCGVLAVMTGLGSGVQNVTGGAVYGHPYPMVHGLWPEVAPYGNSQCVQPQDPLSEPSKVVGCYQCYTGDPNCTTDHQVLFQEHEWHKHGSCAGAKDADTFLQTVCDIALAPLKLLYQARQSGVRDLGGFERVLKRNGPQYEVFASNETTSQLMLSACADEGGHWVLTPRRYFSTFCGKASTREPR